MLKNYYCSITAHYFLLFRSSCHSCVGLSIWVFYTYAHSTSKVLKLSHHVWCVLNLSSCNRGLCRFDSHCQIKGCITPAAQSDCKWLQFTTWCNRKPAIQYAPYDYEPLLQEDQPSAEIGDKIEVKPAMKWQRHFSPPQILQLLEGWTRKISLMWCFDDGGKDGVLASVQNLLRVQVDYLLAFKVMILKSFSDLSCPVLCWVINLNSWQILAAVCLLHTALRTVKWRKVGIDCSACLLLCWLDIS